VSDAHRMNPESGNALLEVLEEPPDRTTLILTSFHVPDLLPTVVSRCQQIRFNPVSREDLAALVAGKQGAEPAKAEAIAHMAGGSVTRALSMLASDWARRRDWVLSVLGPDQAEPIAAMPAGLLLACAERLSRDRDGWVEAMQVLKSWIRDLVVSKYHCRHVINADRMEALQDVSQRTGLARLLTDISAIQAAEREAQTNQNLRLITERLVMRLAGSMP